MYNAERYIEETLRSLMAQTMQTFHLLIIDDCSTDGSVEVVKHFFEKHPRQYELITLTENGGIANARDFALRHAETPYLIYIDADDIPLPFLLEKEYSLLSGDQELMAVSSWSLFIDINSNPIGGGLFIGDNDKISFKNRAEKNKLVFLPIQTMFERKAAIKVGGFQCEGFPNGNPRFRDYCEDLDLWTRMSDLYKEKRYIVTIPEVLYHYRKSNSLSSNHFNMIIKMRYVKANLLRRRSGKSELTFVDYLDSLSPDVLNDLKREATCADFLRNGVFYLKEFKILMGIIMILKALILKPSYVIDKLRLNVRFRNN